MDAVAALTDRVLIVDDEPANVRLLERILAAAGYTEVHATTDPRDAEHLFSQLQPDLVLLDLHMAHLDGLAVLARLQAQLPAGAFVPVLVLTADSTSATMQQALVAGATDFLVKPFDRIEVLLRIANLLKTRRLHVDLQAHNRNLQDQLDAQADHEAQEAAARQALVHRITGVLEGEGLSIVYQPIAHLRTGAVVGAEALARFAPEPVRPPNIWFDEAATVGLGTRLEMAAIAEATSGLDDLPAEAYLAVNVSPETVQSPQLADLVGRLPARRLVLELTEHTNIGDYDQIDDILRPLRASGVRLSVDDAGAGFASLRHILNLKPDIIKLDIALIRGVDLDPARRALAAALVSFATEIGAVLVAEGIETQGELAALRSLHVVYGQGFHLCRPRGLPLPAILPITGRDVRSAAERSRTAASA